MTGRTLLAAMTVATGALFTATGSAHAEGRATRTPIPLDETAECRSAPASVDDLGRLYYRPTRAEQESKEFLKQLRGTLGGCEAWGEGDYAVVFFVAAPAPGKNSVVHLIVKRTRDSLEEVRVLPGVSSLTWVHLTDVADEAPAIQVSYVAHENPLLAKLGSLAAVVVPGVAATARGGPSPKVFVSKAVDVKVDFRRATMTVQFYLTRGGGPRFEDLSTEVEIRNVPPTVVTLHAGVGLLVGGLRGAEPAVVEGERYVSDPISRAATLAGAAWHLPFDPTSPRPTGRERFGLVTAAVLTPTPGLFVGPSFGWRSFSLTTGPAWLWVKAPPKGVDIGAEGSKLVRRNARSWFVGGTYVFSP